MVHLEPLRDLGDAGPDPPPPSREPPQPSPPLTPPKQLTTEPPPPTATASRPAERHAGAPPRKTAEATSDDAINGGTPTELRPPSAPQTKVCVQTPTSRPDIVFQATILHDFHTTAAPFFLGRRLPCPALLWVTPAEPVLLSHVQVSNVLSFHLTAPPVRISSPSRLPARASPPSSASSGPLGGANSNSCSTLVRRPLPPMQICLAPRGARKVRR